MRLTASLLKTRLELLAAGLERRCRYLLSPEIADQLVKMERDWDQRARENARHYIATEREHWGDDDFYASGEQTVYEYILTDLGNVCQGSNPKTMKVLEIGCGAGRVTFVVRAHVPPLSLVPAIRLHARSKTAALAKVRPMTAYVAREIAPLSFTAVLAVVFAALALLLSATGIYGVLNYQVSRRRPEMGIRMALGARARHVERLVLRQGLGLAASGVALGVAGALIAARWLGALVYGVSPRDPLSYAAGLALLPAAVLLGCWRPAWRAAAADPAEIIRDE